MLQKHQTHGNEGHGSGIDEGSQGYACRHGLLSPYLEIITKSKEAPHNDYKKDKAEKLNNAIHNGLKPLCESIMAP